MKVLIACEESQVVCKAFRARGHDAFSCDIQECSGGHPEWHIQDDVLYHLDEGWDLMIAHPPCTFLSTVANRWFTERHLNSVLDFERLRRLEARITAIKFVQTLMDAPIEKIAIENPVGVLSSKIRKPDQIIHPYYFGDPHQKQTCLWLKNIPALTYGEFEKPEPVYYLKSNGKPITFVESLGRHPQRRKLRAKTFPGIANAMAEQWG
jgi:hypothetical protein